MYGPPESAIGGLFCPGMVPSLLIVIELLTLFALGSYATFVDVISSTVKVSVFPFVVFDT